MVDKGLSDDALKPLLRSKTYDDSEMDITPMIDITFLLLIFFITVTQVSDAAKEPIDLPKQKGEEDEKIAWRDVLREYTQVPSERDTLLPSPKETASRQGKNWRPMN